MSENVIPKSSTENRKRIHLAELKERTIGVMTDLTDASNNGTLDLTDLSDGVESLAQTLHALIVHLEVNEIDRSSPFKGGDC